jgi:6-phosphogluconolactonase
MPRHFYLEEFATVDAFVDAAAYVISEELERARSILGAVMLSGGRTPPLIYRAILKRSLVASERAYVMFSDERHVAVESDESNYGAALRLLESGNIPDKRVLRVHTELPLGEAADRYNIELRSYLSSGGRIPLALIGIGPDGHTCSLFGEEDLARARGRLAIAVSRDAGADRISVTPELLGHADRIIVMAIGDDKDAIVKQLLSTPESIVAGQALLACMKVEVWRA